MDDTLANLQYLVDRYGSVMISKSVISPVYVLVAGDTTFVGPKIDELINDRTVADAHRVADVLTR